MSDNTKATLWAIVSLVIVFGLGIYFGRLTYPVEDRIVEHTYTISTEQKECEKEGGVFNLKYDRYVTD